MANNGEGTSGSRGRKDVALRLRAAAEEAVRCIGLGYDMTLELGLDYCKKPHLSDQGPQLIAIDHDNVRDVAIPGGILVQNVPKSINCDKGERVRFSSDVLSFRQMCELLNQQLSVGGKIPSGHFNAAFEFSGNWQKDASLTKSLALDGVFITLFSVELEKSQVVLQDHIKRGVPPSWNPSALAKFIREYGTHIIAGVKMGGKEVVYMKQEYTSPLKLSDVKKRLKDFANNRFGNGGVPQTFSSKYNSEGIAASLDSMTPIVHSMQEQVTFFWRRKGGGSSKNMSHDRWCQAVHSEPEVISMSFIPISSLLSSIDGSGFLTHAINLYLRHKPPLEELEQFLEFQLPKQWAPILGDVPLGPDGKVQTCSFFKIGFNGPKLYVNINEVEVGNKPVTGLRLYMEGKKSNLLAIHMQHLSSLPDSFQLENLPSMKNPISYNFSYWEKIYWKSSSLVCTAPVESDDELSIVTGARLDVKEYSSKKVLFLNLQYSHVKGATLMKKPEWDGPLSQGNKSSFFSGMVSRSFSTPQKPQMPPDLNINSALYPDGPPMPAKTLKLLRFVDTMEMTRGPQDHPGYWVVSGARLLVNAGKISLCVKYSLLSVIAPDSEA